MEELCDKKTSSIVITIFLMKAMGMWYTTNKKEQIMAIAMGSYVVGGLIYGCFLHINGFYHGRHSLTLICDAVPYLFAVLSDCSKYLIFLANREKLTEFSKSVFDNFWNVQYDREETAIFNRCNNSCIKALVYYLLILPVLIVHMVLQPYIEPIGNATTNGRWQLPFPIYTDYPIYESPVYEIILISESFFAFGIMISIMCFPTFLMVTNKFMAAQFTMLNQRMRRLGDCSINDVITTDLQFQTDAHVQLKNCIRKHQFLIGHVETMESLYCYVTLSQIFATIAQLSCSAVIILMSKGSLESQLNKTLLRTELLLGSLVQFYFYAESAHEILTESENLAEAIYSSNWFSIDRPEYRKDFSQLVRLVCLRAQRPCILTVGKFSHLTLVTLQKVLRTSMSFFTVMRQTMH